MHGRLVIEPTYLTPTVPTSKRSSGNSSDRGACGRDPGHRGLAASKAYVEAPGGLAAARKELESPEMHRHSRSLPSDPGAEQVESKASEVAEGVAAVVNVHHLPAGSGGGLAPG